MGLATTKRHFGNFIGDLTFFGLFCMGCVGIVSCTSVRSVRESEKPVAKGYTVESLSDMAERSGDVAPRKRILVLPFLNESLYQTKAIADQARLTVAQDLAQADDFIITSNDDLPRSPQDFLANKEYNLTSLAPFAQALGVAAVVEGKILEIKARRLSDPVGVMRQLKVSVEAIVRIRVVAAKNGHEVVNEVRSARVDSSLTRFLEYQEADKNLLDDPQLVRGVVLKAFRGLGAKIAQAVDKMSWEGRVALVMSDKVYINAGRLSGLQVGDVLRVMDEGEEVYDPETGVLLGRTQGRMKGTIEIVNYFGKDGSVAVVHSGSGFRENDRVQLY